MIEAAGIALIVTGAALLIVVALVACLPGPDDLNPRESDRG